MIDIYFDVNTEKRVDSSGGNSISDLNLKYQSHPTWRVYFKKVDKAAATVTAVDLSAAVAWKAAVDDDFDHTSEPMCRTLDADIDSSQAAAGIIDVPLDADTSTFAASIGTKANLRQVYFELRGFDSSGEEVHSARIEIVALNIVDPNTGDPPDPISDYYTKVQDDALLAGKADKVGADDIEITDATKGVILRDSNGVRYRLTVTTNGALKITDLTE